MESHWCDSGCWITIETVHAIWAHKFEREATISIDFIV